MPYYIKILAMADGRDTEHANRWLAEFDPDWQPASYRGPRCGLVVTTDDLAQALPFDSPTDAMDCWRTRSTRIPTRPDGQPNRPMTAFTTTIVNEPTIEFGDLSEADGYVKTRSIRKSDIAACPTARLDPGHYRDDGTCRCYPEGRR